MNACIVFAGKRWRITAIHNSEKVIEVVADPKGLPPKFLGPGGVVHDRIVQKMKDVLMQSDRPRYLDRQAMAILDSARTEFGISGLDRHRIVKTDDRNAILATWTGSIKTNTLAIVLSTMGYNVTVYCGFLEVSGDKKHSPPIMSALRQIAYTRLPKLADVLTGRGGLDVEKFHPYLSTSLLIQDAESRRFDLDAMPELAQAIFSAAA